HMDAQFSQVSPKDFFLRALKGTALGIIIGLIPNAILATILQYFSGFALGASLVPVVKIFRLATPLIFRSFIFFPFPLVVGPVVSPFDNLDVQIPLLFLCLPSFLEFTARYF
ncbi:hypothetical protein ACEF17_10485, partial [Streptococcus hyovaginalis]